VQLTAAGTVPAKLSESHIMLELYNPNDPTDMVTLELPRITVVAE